MCLAILSKYPAERLIFDNAQAFFVEPFDNVHTIYSPRKFLPIADSGFLIIKKTISKIELEHESISEDVLLQYQHLFKRLIYGANKGYADFLEIEESFNNEIPGNLSPLTEKFLDTFSYTALRKKRLENFLFLHEKLASYNQLVINIEEVASPLTYPFMYTNAKRFTDKLISNSIYSPVYWSDCLERISENMFEDLLIKHTTHLICDHRYNVSDMEYQLKLIMSYLL